MWLGLTGEEMKVFGNLVPVLFIHEGGMLDSNAFLNILLLPWFPYKSSCALMTMVKLCPMPCCLSQMQLYSPFH